MSEKVKCKCGKMAVWLYLPGFPNSSSIEDDVFCDDCISSSEDQGCSCNYHYAKQMDRDGFSVDLPEGTENIDYRWVNVNEGIWIDLDSKGRPYPCVEFDYDEEGFNINDD